LGVDWFTLTLKYENGTIFEYERVFAPFKKNRIKNTMQSKGLNHYYKEIDD
jgi:hypothetical protein